VSKVKLNWRRNFIKIYGYVRVSTRGQLLDGNSVEDQTKKIKEKYPNAEIIVEAYSGAKERPIFNDLLKDIELNSLIVCTKLDRFCRTAKEGLEYIDFLRREKNVSIHILNMGLIEDTPMGKLIITNLLAFAEFERSLIIERTQSGKSIAKQNNPMFRDGRPKKFKREQRMHCLELLNSGKSYNEVSAITGISVSTLHRIRRELSAKEILGGNNDRK